jgi:hypothetical protein
VVAGKQIEQQAGVPEWTMMQQQRRLLLNSLATAHRILRRRET